MASERPELNDLLSVIDLHKRQINELINAGRLFSDPLVVRASRQLDDYLNLFYRLCPAGRAASDRHSMITSDVPC